jgi:hypothetical protein
MGMDELLLQPTFPDARFTYCRHHLTVPRFGLLQRLTQGDTACASVIRQDEHPVVLVKSHFLDVNAFFLGHILVFVVKPETVSSDIS